MKIDMPLPAFMINLTSFDRHGNIIVKRREEGHSWVRNAWNWMFASMTDSIANGGSAFGAGKMTVRNSAGTIYSGTTSTANRSHATVPYTSGIINSATTVTLGIVVGRGTTDFDVDQIALATLIAHGTSANQLSYQAQAVPVVSYDPAAKAWTCLHTRNLMNNSTAVVTVTEVGIMRSCPCFSLTTAVSMLMARDLLSSGIDVPVAGSLQVQYEMKMSFVGID